MYGINPLAHVTVTSDSATQHAVMDVLWVQNSSNLTFSELTLQHKPTVVGDHGATVAVKTSHDISFVHDEVMSNVDGSIQNDAGGIQIDASSRISVLDSKFHDLHWSMLTRTSDHIVIAGNDVRMVREGFDFGGDSYVTIDGNLFTNFKPELSGSTPDHPDAIQFWTTNTTGSSHIEISNNAFLFGQAQPIQGIFFGNEGGNATRHSDVNILDNVYYGQSHHGISVYYADGVKIEGNSVLSAPNINSSYYYFDPGINTFNTTGAVVDHNLASTMSSTNDTGRVASDNIDVWDRDTGIGLAYSTIFAHAPGPGSSAAWFAPKPGSAPALQHIGYDNTELAGNWASVTPAAIAHYANAVDHAGAAFHIA